MADRSSVPKRDPKSPLSRTQVLFYTQKNRAGTAKVLESRPFRGCHPSPHPPTVSGQTKPERPGRHSQASAAGRRSYPGLFQGAAASPGLGCGAAGRARLGGAGPRRDEMAAASGRPRLRSGPRPRPRPRRLGPEKAQRALPGVHHGPARGTGSTPRPPLPGEARKAGPPAGRGQRILAGPARVASPGRRPRQARAKQKPAAARADGEREAGAWLQAGRTDPAPARRSSAGAERSRHVCPFLSRFLCFGFRASGLKRRRADKAASRHGRCGALQGRAALLSPLAPPRRDVSTRRGAGEALWAVNSMWLGFAGLSRLGGWAEPARTRDEFPRGT